MSNTSDARRALDAAKSNRRNHHISVTLVFPCVEWVSERKPSDEWDAPVYSLLLVLPKLSARIRKLAFRLQGQPPFRVSRSDGAAG